MFEENPMGESEGVYGPGAARFDGSIRHPPWLTVRPIVRSSRAPRPLRRLQPTPRGPQQTPQLTPRTPTPEDSWPQEAPSQRLKVSVLVATRQCTVHPFKTGPRVISPLRSSYFRVRQCPYSPLLLIVTSARSHVGVLGLKTWEACAICRPQASRRIMADSTLGQFARGTSHQVCHQLHHGQQRIAHSRQLRSRCSFARPLLTAVPSPLQVSPYPRYQGICSSPSWRSATPATRSPSAALARRAPTTRPSTSLRWSLY